MPSLTQTLALASMASLTLAMSLTSPTKFQLWDSSKTNTISWSAVSTDPQTIDIYLAHMAAHPPLYSLLFSSVATSSGKIDVSGLQLPNGEAYQINLVAHDNDKQILAQSQQFNVTGEAVQATSTLDGYTGPTYTPTASGATASGSVTRTGTLTTITRTSSDASGSLTTETSTSTASADDAESTESTTGTASDEAPSQTVAAASTSASASATRTPNAAVGNVAASGSIAALFFGVAALLV